MHVTAASNAKEASYDRHEYMEFLLGMADIVDPSVRAPAVLPMIEAALEGAIRQAGWPVALVDSDREDAEWAGRGARVQAELPAGIPVWPPRVFLTRERTHTMG